MLLRYSVANHRSIDEEQSISMVAARLKENREPMPVSFGREIDGVLPCAIIYGANASGKSNIIGAMRFIRDAVLRSHRGADPDDHIIRNPFALCEDRREAPSEFEVDFVVEGIRYNFGFTCTDISFSTEWLYSFPEGRRRKLYERTGDEIVFGTSMRGAKKTLSELLRKNSLFISVATQNVHEELSKVASFFRGISFVSDAVSDTSALRDIDEETIGFLSSLGTGIVDGKVEHREMPESMKAFMADFALAAEKHLEIKRPDFKDSLDQRPELLLGHKARDEKLIYFGIEQESRGTRRLLSMMGRVFTALGRGTPIFVDEIDLSLHTHAVERIIDLFANPSTNPNGAQLVATTHDTNLLSSKHLRRDEVWFSEKSKVGASEYFPMSDLNLRLSDDFEKGYLEGRFGAVPLV